MIWYIDIGVKPKPVVNPLSNLCLGSGIAQFQMLSGPHFGAVMESI